MSGDLGSLSESREAIGDWILPRLHPFKQNIGSVVPSGFEDYCRIFHPVVPSDPSAPAKTWTEVASQNGRIAHPGMQFHMVNRPVGAPAPIDDDQDQKLSWGSLPVAEAVELVDLLRHYTATPENCWFCVWTGYAEVDEDTGGAQRFHHPAREYAVLSGPIDTVVDGSHPALKRRSPNLWWPQDRRWIVVTEIEDAWTYVGGPGHLVEDLVSHRGLEVMRVGLTDEPFYGSDRANTSLDG